MTQPSEQDLFQYLDYQEYLRDYCALEKKRDSLFSYRVFAQILGMDASLLVKILQGKRHLSHDGVECVLRFLKLDRKRADYFRELVAYGKASRDVDLRRHFEALLSLRPSHGNTLAADRYRYFQHWYYAAIRSALDVFTYHGNDDAEALARTFRPTIDATQVCEAVGVLQRLGLVEADGSGRIRPAFAHVSTGERWQSMAVREFQRQWIALASESLSVVDPQERDVSSLTLAVDATQLERIRAVLAEARRSVVSQVDAMAPEQCNAVYQLNIQLFPVMELGRKV